jgi:hypothetical protein
MEVILFPLLTDVNQHLNYSYRLSLFHNKLINKITMKKREPVSGIMTASVISFVKAITI